MLALQESPVGRTLPLDDSSGNNSHRVAIVLSVHGLPALLDQRLSQSISSNFGALGCRRLITAPLHPLGKEG
jgi:hypothetical protein